MALCTHTRRADDAYVPDSAIRGARATAATSVYIDTPLTRPRTDPPGGGNTASVYADAPLTTAGNTTSFYAEAPLTTAAADTSGYEVAHDRVFTGITRSATVGSGGYEVPLDATTVSQFRC